MSAVRLGIDIGALHSSASVSRHLLAVNFRLYLDDSGSPEGGPVFAMGGYLSPEKRWKQFARSWQRALDDAGLDLFHAKEFFPVLGKKWPKEKHVRFSRRFTAIAEKHTSMGIARGIDTSAYSDLVLPEPLFRVDTPHERFGPILFCVQTCLEHVAKRMQPYLVPLGEQIAVVFEQGDGVGKADDAGKVAGVPAGEVIQWCLYLKRRSSWGSIYSTFTPGAKSILPLQAADLFAYEARRYMIDTAANKSSAMRKSFQNLIKSKNVSIGMGTRKQFEVGIDQIRRFTQDPFGLGRW